MKLIRVTVVPLELFEKSIRRHVEKRLIDTGALIPGVQGSLAEMFKELIDDTPSLYYARNIQSGHLVAFHGTSACFVKVRTIADWQASIPTIREELLDRKAFHISIQQSQTEIFGIHIPSFNKKHPYIIAPAYAFSFYIIEATQTLTADQNIYTKLLAEPSVLDLDDMWSSRNPPPSNYALSDKDLATLNRIEDCDLSQSCKTHITWASICAVENGGNEALSKTFDTLLVLEIKLQMLWNKCHALSNLADAIFSGTAKHPNFSEFYWEIARSFDDAKGVLSCTSSSRVNALFVKMIDTSNIEGEISRLENKVSLSEKFIAQQLQRGDSRYRKLIELLLFVMALSQLAPAFFSLPLGYFKDRPFLSTAVMSIAFIIGLIAISARRL
jgi:hypothetical protein